MRVSLVQYSHVLIFNVEGEPKITMSLTRQADGEPLSGVISQQGFEPYVFSYSGHIKIPVLIEAIKMYDKVRLSVNESGCVHIWDWANEYHGNCPQPKRCTICGALDLNGYKGVIR